MNTPLPLRLSSAVLAAMTAAVLIPSIGLSQATTGFNQTAAGTYDYNTPANWVDENINGIWDLSLKMLGNQTVTFSADTVLTTGLTFNYDLDTTGFNVTLTGTGGARTLTLGGDILVNTVSTTRTITLGSATTAQNLNVDLGGVTRAFTVGTGRTLSMLNVISNGGVTASGGTISFSGTNTYSGATTVSSGTLSLNGATGSSANSDITVKAGGASASTLTFASTTSGNTGTTRAKSVNLNGSGSSTGATLTVSGNAGANSNDVITNALEATKGFSTVTVSANAARNAQLSAGSFSRQDGATILFRGSDLGVSSIASLTAGDANIVFTNAPTLAGSGTAGTSSVGIIKGAYGAITTSGNGTGLVTYDTTNGVRLLANNEYTAAITNGQSTLDNIRYVRASGGASQDINLTATTTINSLSFNVTGAGTNSGVTISGDAGTTLKIASGMIFASQTVTAAVASDAMIISAPTLDLNGQEGVIIAFTNGVSNGNTNAPLQINSSITNDGGKGVTIGGTGQVIFGGTSNNTYTGPTTLNSGILRLNKSGTGINSLTSDLVMNGGTLLKTNNTIVDTASVTINGGSFVMDSTTSSGNNGTSETINNLTMSGGTLIGSGGTGSALTINGDMSLSGGLVRLNAGGDVTVLGTTNLSGGVLTAKESSSTTVFNGLTSLNAVNITNTASGAYTAITVQGHATSKGAQLTLGGDLTFTGNGTNTNSVRIASNDSLLANQGVFRLSGTRTFAIGDGAAATDLAVEIALVDGTSTGGLVKSGAGTLALSGANTYSGNTAVNAGALVLADTGSFTFYIGANGVNNSITGSGSVTFNGSFNFDFTNAVATEGNSWLIVNTGTLTESFTGSFSAAGFTENANVWTLGNYSFSEATGILSYAAVPEPSSFALLAGAGLIAFTAVRRKPRAA